MGSILDFLRQGFGVLETIPIDDLDNLFEEIRLYQVNPERLSNTNKLNYLIAQTGHFYYLVGKKISQAQAVRDQLEKSIDFKLEEISNQINKPFNQANKKEIEKHAIKDVDYLRYQNELALCEGMITFLKNSFNALFMQHYSLRNQNIQNMNQQQINHFQ